MATRQQQKRESRKTSAQEWAKRPSVSGSEATCIKLPEGVEWFKLDREGVIKVDFMPYRCGKNNRRADEGEDFFEFEYEAHRVPTGDGNKMYICPQKMLNKKCAVCDWLVKNGATADPELVGKLRTTTRHLWVVNDKPGDPKNPLKVFDTNHFNKKKGFGEQMGVVIQTLDEGEDPFALSLGYTALLTVQEETAPFGKYKLVTRIDLRARKYEYPDKLLDKAPCLDECIVIPDYAAVLALLEGGEPPAPDRNGDDEDEAPIRKPKAKKREEPEEEGEELDDEVEDDEPEEEEEEAPAKGKSKRGPKGEHTADEYDIDVGCVVTYKGKKCEVMKVSSDGTSLLLEAVEDGREFKGVAPEDVKVVPSKNSAKPKKKVGGDEDDEDELNDGGFSDELEDDEDAPPARKGKAGGKTSEKGGSSKRAAKDEEDDEPKSEDDDFEGWDEDEEPEEEEEEKPKKKPAGKRR